MEHRPSFRTDPGMTVWRLDDALGCTYQVSLAEWATTTLTVCCPNIGLNGDKSNLTSSNLVNIFDSCKDAVELSVRTTSSIKLPYPHAIGVRSPSE